MALVTKQTLYENTIALIEGGDPSIGKKFERRMIEAFLQQAINRKLKTEYLSVTLPGDETIPDGLVLACYDNVPVGTYKTNFSRAQLPAMPISLRRNMGVFFVGPAQQGGGVPIIPIPIITIEVVIGLEYVITGSTEVVTGLVNGSTVVTCAAFANSYWNVIRGNVPIPGINPGDGSNYFTKNLPDDFITFSTPLVTGEYVKIQQY